MRTRTPAIVVHGGAGSISRANLPPSSPQYAAYVSSLRSILSSIYPLLLSGTSALDAACAAVRLFEDNPLFNSGKGAVFNRAGKNELEASVMVSRGAQKRGVGVELLTRVKNPILLARELLLRQEEEEGQEGAGVVVPGETTRHNCISGPEAERLAGAWGCEIVDEDYFWTEKRWKEHLRGLEHEHGHGQQQQHGIIPGGGEELEEYLPQGTVGCVVLDIYGTLCTATSTGGLTNKIPGRIGDTPTLGAGFWAEEWAVSAPASTRAQPQPQPQTRAVALSGTGNGDYFLRLGAAHAVAARCRFGGMQLQAAMDEVVGVGGELQEAAGGRWGLGDGEAGCIGIDERGKVAMSMNSGGMFRGYIDEEGRTRVGVFRDEEET